MAHLALYRAFRPQTFDEVVAQTHIVYPLRQSVRNGTVNHALLFAGTRGTGKTSLAKIYAKAINCLNPDDGNPCNACEICRGANDGSLLDILEMDAASNNSVDNIRRMTDEVIYTPVSAQYKVYIIDEAHMLSGGAFNALLKTLEEPPEHVVFILATTEVHRIPATIASRCQRYDFRRIGVPDIEKQLKAIAAAETIEIEDDAVRTIASLADGAMRDAISLLDQASSGADGRVTRQDILDLVGLTSDETMLVLLETIVRGEPHRLLDAIDELSMAGRDLHRLTLDLAGYFRHMLVLKYAEQAASVSQLPQHVRSALKALAPNVSADRLIEIIRKLSELLSDLRFSGQPRTTLDIGLLALLDAAPAEPAKTSAPIAAAASEKDVSPPVPQATPDEAPAAVLAEPAVDASADAVEDAVPDSANKDHTAAADTSVAAGVAPPPADIPHLELLDVWDNVLHGLSENQRMDLRLMAKSADVSLDDRVFTVRIREGMQGAYQLLNKKDALELLTSLVVKHLARPVSVTIAYGDGTSQASAEEDWLRTLRERT